MLKIKEDQCRQVFIENAILADKIDEVRLEWEAKLIDVVEAAKVREIPPKIRIKELEDLLAEAEQEILRTKDRAERERLMEAARAEQEALHGDSEKEALRKEVEDLKAELAAVRAGFNAVVEENATYPPQIAALEVQVLEASTAGVDREKALRKEVAFLEQEQVRLKDLFELEMTQALSRA